jgi:hypothetical protein
VSERLRRGLAIPVFLLVTACAEGSAGEPADWEDFSSARQLDGVEHLDVEVTYGAGSLELAPAEGDLLYRFETSYDASTTRPYADFDPAAGTLRLGIRGREEGVSGNFGDEAHASVALAPEVPTSLEIRFGAGQADLELGGLALDQVQVQTGASETTLRWSEPNRIQARQVRLDAGAASLEAIGLGNANAAEFEIRGGVGETTLDFGGEWSRSASARVRMGLGSLTLRLPRSLGVRVEKRGAMTSFDGAGLVKRDNGYYSRNWESAETKLTLDIDAALGSIAVEWIP